MYRRVLEDSALEERRARQLVVLLRLEVVARQRGVHERPEREDDEHEREPVRRRRVVGRGRRGRCVRLAVEVREHLFVELLARDRVVPGMMRIRRRGRMSVSCVMCLVRESNRLG